MLKESDDLKNPRLSIIVKNTNENSIFFPFAAYPHHFHMYIFTCIGANHLISIFPKSFNS
ncbi:MAG: hypothetical protein DMENIID0002_02630 [Rickettsia endosymbiont of Sergentomyia squamirostris]|uniref:Uncharacterized protein n=1 Tax=Candidatus Tisiphia endosymbiont of Sergentomyia squamirostris TaxID=3113639 RepID=A0AAT9G720_9RICK